MYLCAKIYLKNKDEVTYDRMLTLLKQNALNNGYDLKPEKVTVDFEQSAINSFERIFKCIVKGKFSILNQNFFLKFIINSKRLLLSL